ncbi:sugar ABC transporter ATP-binding protein [Enterocloster bolteae]|uniref:sugar ABC transporter ATP-binding protein n=1 Tax=Enterocloster bolteae TaxID=208479 RepID=UPI002A8140A4|nr:sugar ABC transporter ATP-binding protein [Enterocloster bolteae]
MAEEIILKAESISKSFGGVKALQNVSFELKKGEILSVIGENGAGKSTLMKIVAGALKNDKGEIYFEGKKLSLNSPLDAVKTGISIVYQEPNIFADMSVLENIFMGNEVVNLNKTIQWTKMYEEAVEALKLVGLNGNILHLTMSELSIGNQQLVLIARGIYKKCKILILDEPTSILSHGESEKLFEIIADLKSKGVSIMYISHRIPEILQISDNIIVLRDGCLTGTLSPREADEESIITAMSGRKINMSVYQTREIKDDTILEVRNLGYKNQYQNITFSLKPGEILGMYGLVGSGRSEIARAIFGETKAETGNIIFEGKDITGTDINGAIEKNIFYVPEDRGAQGLFDIHPIRDNMSVSFLDGFSNKFSFIRKKEERKAVQDNIEKYSIKTPSQDLSVNSLSGGGQQKVLLCRWLMRKPKVLILDEPTRGIDVATKAEIHKYIMELAAEGVAILVISSDLPEIMGVSDRILTLHKGTITAEFDRETVTEEKILKNALNLSDQSLSVHSEEV